MSSRLLLVMMSLSLSQVSENYPPLNMSYRLNT